MKTAISLPDPLFEAADRVARQLGVSRSELFQRAVQRLVDEFDETRVTSALNAIYGGGGEPAHVDPILEELQRRALPSEDWA